MRRLVYLANAIAELFICLLPGSASRECLYIWANTPRESYARGSPSFFFFFCSRPTWLCCCRTKRTIDSLLSFLRYVRLSISTFVSVTSISPVLFPFLSFLRFFSCALSLSPPLTVLLEPLHNLARKKRKQKIDEKEWPRGEQGWHKDDLEESFAKWIRYLTSTSSRVRRVSSGTENDR